LTLAEVNDACSLVHEAADPDANIIFGSVIDPNLTEEVRITVIATGFQSRVAVETSTSSAGRSSVKKPADHQMTLPMHGHVDSSPVLATPTMPIVSAPLPAQASMPPAHPMPVASAAPNPVSAPLEATDTEVEIDEAEIHRYPPLSSLVTPAPVFAQSGPVCAHAAPVVQADRQTPAPDSRPVIRPAVASPIASANMTSSARRVTPSGPTSLATAHLGIEESEFDKPTYLRRALAGDGMRSPGDGKG
jgi:hypothetical protein